MIVGGGPAGLTAALYAARAGQRPLILERGVPGGQIVQAARVENYPGMAALSGADFALALLEQAQNQGARLQKAAVTGFMPLPEGYRLETGHGPIAARAVILATGRSPRKLGLPGEDALVGHGLSYCAVCDGAFYAGQDAAVIGGGNSAFQDALFLAARCRSVTLIHRNDRFRADQALQARLYGCGNVRILPDRQVTSLAARDSVLTGVRLAGADGPEELPLDGLFVAIGQEPQARPFAESVTLTGGYYAAGEDTCTNLPRVFAAGDGRVKTVRQLTTAASDGTVAALAACKALERAAD